jgi:hypothetical protein
MILTIQEDVACEGGAAPWGGSWCLGVFCGLLSCLTSAAGGWNGAVSRARLTPAEGFGRKPVKWGRSSQEIITSTDTPLDCPIMSTPHPGTSFAGRFDRRPLLRLSNRFRRFVSAFGLVSRTRWPLCMQGSRAPDGSPQAMLLPMWLVLVRLTRAALSRPT